MPAAPHIFTLTGNLLAEHTFEFAAWSPGQTQRASRQTFQVGGKGINVTKMLRRLGATSTALGFTAGASGAECEAWLREQKIPFVAFPTDQPTRRGTVVRGANRPETTFLGPDVPPAADAIRACAAFLDAQPDGQILAVCGSLPGWTEENYHPLRDAFARWARRGNLVADTYGPPLGWFAGQDAGILIKINADEFRSFVNREASTLDTATAIWPRSRWIVTDGERAVWFAQAGEPAASLAPPRVREVSATGSGDVLFACVLHALFVLGLSLREAVASALPYAAANAAHPGVADFSLNALPEVPRDAASTD